MWIFRYFYCLLQGHAFVDVVTTPRHPYQYCLHCGKIKEPVAIVKTRHTHTQTGIFEL